MWIQWPFLQKKNLNQRSLTPRWPLTSHLLRSHVRLYPRIIVSMVQVPWKYIKEKKISGQSHNAQCFYVILDQPPIMHNAFMMTRINSANFLHTAEYMFTQALFWRTQFAKQNLAGSHHFVASSKHYCPWTTWTVSERATLMNRAHS